MSYQKPWGAVPARARVRCGAVATRSSGRAAPRAVWVLLILFISLQVADVVTTNYALAIPGNWEVNPLMRFSQTYLGSAWWLPKATAAALAAAVVLRIRRAWPIACAVSYYALIVSGNLACL
jgi:Domain of unknown function (DUF5658)